MKDNYRTPERIVRRDARTLEDWRQLAKRSPAAVPTQVARTLAHRYPDLRQRLGFA